MFRSHDKLYEVKVIPETMWRSKCKVRHLRWFEWVEIPLFRHEFDEEVLEKCDKCAFTTDELLEIIKRNDENGWGKVDYYLPEHKFLWIELPDPKENSSLTFLVKAYYWGYPYDLMTYKLVIGEGDMLDVRLFYRKVEVFKGIAEDIRELIKEKKLWAMIL